MAKDNDMNFFECSAMQNTGVERAFLTMAREVKNRVMSAPGGTGGPPAATQKLNASNANGSGSKGGCC